MGHCTRLPLAVLAVALLAPALSSAQTPQAGIYELVATHSGQCLAVASASQDNGARVVQSTCNGGGNQRWRVSTPAPGVYRFEAHHSGQTLDVAGASREIGAAIIQFPPDGSQHQQWTLVGAMGGYQLMSRESGLMITIPFGSFESGAAAVQSTSTLSPGQLFTLRYIEAVPAEASRADAVRFLEQATWGPTTSLIDHVVDVGIETYLAEQFGAPASSYPTLPLYPGTRDTVACPNGSTCQRDNYSLYLPQNRFFLNALYGEDQLRQRVAFALHQILVVSGVEVNLPARLTPYLQLLDRHAFGNFRDLLIDLSLNPAMGVYLDAQGNTKTRPNENYAREILQLFSIGTVRLNLDGTPVLDGNGQTIPTYTQSTVDNFARVFTGWRFAAAPAAGITNYSDPMVALESQHDTGVKTLLDGAVTPQGLSARADLELAIDNIFHHANIGPFISRQLIQHLVTSNPSPAYVARVATVFNGAPGGARGDLAAVVRAILLDPEARGDAKTDALYGRLRHPVQLVTNILRTFDVRSADGTGPSDGYLAPQLPNMGMDLFRPPSVFSYFSPSGTAPNTGGLRGPEFGLFSTSTALKRANFINTMVFGRIAASANGPMGTAIDLAPLQPLAATPDALLDVLNDRLLHGTMSATMRQTIRTAVTAVSATNTLKRVRTAVYLVLTSSQYQVER